MLGRLVAFVPTVDLGRSHAFFADALRLRRVEQTGFANAYEAVGGLIRVTRVNRLAPAAFTIVGFQVGDIEAAIDRLERRGVRFMRYPDLTQDAKGVWTSPPGSRIAWFKDPDDNVFSLQQPAQVGGVATS